MTQVKSAQRAGKKVALRKPEDARSLAQRRADFAAQMRAMALSDLKQVSKRLKGLRRELELKEGHKIKQYEVAAALKIPPRTFQSWENGEVENTAGTGYDKIARFYSRKLSRKITRNWILYGSNGAPPPSKVASSEEMEAENVARIEDRLKRIEKSIEELRRTVASAEALTEVIRAIEEAEANRARRRGGSEQ